MMKKETLKKEQKEEARERKEKEDKLRRILKEGWNFKRETAVEVLEKLLEQEPYELLQEEPLDDTEDYKTAMYISYRQHLFEEGLSISVVQGFLFSENTFLEDVTYFYDSSISFVLLPLTKQELNLVQSKDFISHRMGLTLLKNRLETEKNGKNIRHMDKLLGRKRLLSHLGDYDG